MVTILHARVEKHEYICGIRYEIQMPSNEEQSALASAFFVARFIGNALSQTVLVIVYSAASFVLRLRFNFSGYGNTAVRREKLVFAAQKPHENAPAKTAQSDTDMLDEPHAQPQAARPKIEWEITNDTAPIQEEMSGAIADYRRPENRQTVFAKTAANSPANNENSANSQANSGTANSANSELQTLASMRKTGESPRKAVAKGGGQRESDIMVEWKGERYSLRTLKTNLNTYSKRAKDAATSADARQRNAALRDELQAILAPYISQTEAE